VATTGTALHARRPGQICGACAAGQQGGDYGVKKPSIALQAHRADIRRMVEAHHATYARVFGSVARSNDTDDSNLELLIDPTPDTTLLDIGAIRHKLSQLLDIPVDVLTPNALSNSHRATYHKI